jgi:hypothetical protein
MAATKPPEHGRECALMSFFGSPLVEPGKRVSVLKKKYKYISFFDVCKLQDEPQEIVSFMERSTVGSFAVLLVTYADLIDVPEVLVSLLRRRPSCAVMAVPAGKLKWLAQRLMHVHEEFYHQQQRIPEMRDRYQFLLSIIAAIRKDNPIAIALLNPPAPVIR